MKITPEENLKMWRRIRRLTLLGMLIGIYPAYHGLNNLNNLLEFIIIELVMIFGFIKSTSEIWRIKDGIELIKILEEIQRRKFGKNSEENNYENGRK